jgi:hypothetical protein
VIQQVQGYSGRKVVSSRSGQVPSEYGNKLDTKIKPTNAYKHLKLSSYIINIVCLLQVSATVLAILRETHYKGYNTHF